MALRALTTPPPGESLDDDDSTRVASPPPRISLPQQRNNSYHHQHMHSASTLPMENLRTDNNNANEDENNNNNNFPGISSANQQMERVTFHLHSRLCHFGLAHTSYQTREIFQHLLLVAAICCACALLMLHRTFVVTAASATATTSTTATPIVSTCLDRLEGFDPASADITHIIILPHNLTFGSAGNAGFEPNSKILWNRGTGIGETRETQTATTATLQTDSCASTDSMDASYAPEIHSHREWLEQQLASDTLPIEYSYSSTKAYLMLPYDHSWLKHDLNVQYILVAPNDPVCFGEPFVQFLLWNCYIGGNTVLLNWLRTFPAHESAPQTDYQSQQSSKAYIYNPRTEWLKEIKGDFPTTSSNDGTDGNKLLPSKWTKFFAKVGLFLRTSFLFFFCTTLVSFTLRETQERMLEFTRELNRRVRQSISVSDLITTHLIQNLVFVPIMLGMMFFLIEFYHGDKFLAFTITSIIWSVEGFSLVSLRSSQGLQYFPYFFFLLFLLFHVYQSAFEDHGFVYLALTVVWCFMLHSMVFFWHRYELPALVLGAVSIHRPRMNRSVIVSEYHGDDPDGDGSGIGRNNGNGTAAHFPWQQQQQQQQRRDERRVRLDAPSSPTSRGGLSSIDGNHLTTPLFEAGETPATAREAGVAATAAAATMTSRNSSSSLLGMNGGAGGGTGFLPSRQSFHSLSTTSRITSGLYQFNQEDDSSTGSHLYFMGGEVVIQRRTRSNSHSSNSIGNHHTRGNHNSHSSTEQPQPSMRRGNSFGNGPTFSAPLTISGPATEEESSSPFPSPLTTPAPLSAFMRNESNFSLLSSASDAYGSNAASSCNASSSNNNHSNASIIRKSSAAGLDVNGRLNGDPKDDPDETNNGNSLFCETLPNDTSMDTVHTSNMSTPQQHHQNGAPTNNGVANGVTTSTTSDGYYAQESGGLKAIFETKLTPRHRNTAERIQVSLGANGNTHKQPNSSSSSSSSSSTSNGIQYQRKPPTFPELSQPC